MSVISSENSTAQAASAMIDMTQMLSKKLAPKMLCCSERGIDTLMVSKQFAYAKFSRYVIFSPQGVADFFAHNRVPAV